MKLVSRWLIDWLASQWAICVSKLVDQSNEMHCTEEGTWSTDTSSRSGTQRSLLQPTGEYKSQWQQNEENSTRWCRKDKSIRVFFFQNMEMKLISKSLHRANTHQTWQRLGN